MIEETVTLKVTRAVIADIGAARELQDWCEQQPGLICTIAARATGGYAMSVEGRDPVARHEFTIGDTVTWDGQQFSVSHPEA